MFIPFQTPPKSGTVVTSQCRFWYSCIIPDVPMFLQLLTTCSFRSKHRRNRENSCRHIVISDILHYTWCSDVPWVVSDIIMFIPFLTPPKSGTVVTSQYVFCFTGVPVFYRSSRGAPPAQIPVHPVLFYLRCNQISPSAGGGAKTASP